MYSGVVYIYVKYNISWFVELGARENDYFFEACKTKGSKLMLRLIPNLANVFCFATEYTKKFF